MARRKKKKSSGNGEGTPAWLITFSDCMTLLLTFFVLLISMASLTHQRKKELVMTSITQYFGMGSQSLNILGKKTTPELIEPGPMEDLDEYEKLKNLLWENLKEDVEILENRFSYIISIRAEVLFKPKSAELTEKAKKILEQAVPIIKKLKYPILIAGHTSSGLKELGEEIIKGPKNGFSSSWKLSLDRALTVYKFLRYKGIRSEKLRVEAFGKYHPRYSNISPEGRRKNQRVDIIVDKKDVEIARSLKLPKEKTFKKEFEYKGFIFKIP